MTDTALLEDTLGYIATLPAGETVVIVLGPGVFPVYPTDLDVDLIIIADSGGGARRRRVLSGAEGAGIGRQRELQTAGVSVIYALDNARHFSTTRLLALSGVVLQGSLNSAVLSGGVQLTVSES